MNLLSLLDTQHGATVPDELREIVKANPDAAAAAIWSSFGMGVLCLLAGVGAVCALVYFLDKKYIPREQAGRFLITIILATLGCILAVGGYGAYQIAGLVGIFGAVVASLYRLKTHEPPPPA